MHLFQKSILLAIFICITFFHKSSYANDPFYWPKHGFPDQNYLELTPEFIFETYQGSDLNIQTVVQNMLNEDAILVFQATDHFQLIYNRQIIPILDNFYFKYHDVVNESFKKTEIYLTIYNKLKNYYKKINQAIDHFNAYCNLLQTIYSTLATPTQDNTLTVLNFQYHQYEICILLIIKHILYWIEQFQIQDTLFNQNYQNFLWVEQTLMNSQQDFILINLENLPVITTTHPPRTFATKSIFNH